MRTMTAIPLALVAGTFSIAMAAHAEMGSNAAVDGKVDKYTLETVDDANRANAQELTRDRTRKVITQGDSVTVVEGKDYDPSSAVMGNRDSGMTGSRELQEEQDATTTTAEGRALTHESKVDPSSAVMGNRDSGMAGSRELQEEQDGTTTRSEARALSEGSGDRSSATMNNKTVTEGSGTSRELQEEQDGTTTLREANTLAN